MATDRRSTYAVTVVFADGNEVHARVEARDRNEARRRVLENEEYKTFAENCPVVDMTIERERKEIMPWNNHLEVTNVPNKKGWYMAIDLKNNIKLEFKKGDFAKQNVYPLRGEEFTQVDALNMATAMREIADWLQVFFPELVGNKGVKPPRSNEGPNPEDRKYRSFFIRNKAYKWLMDEAAKNGMEPSEYLEWLCSDED